MMQYYECPVLFTLTKAAAPLTAHVEIDDYTQYANFSFDYDFTGETKFYPYMMPKGLSTINFQTMVICGRSGSGKSTFLKNFANYGYPVKTYDNEKSIISNFTGDTPEQASKKLMACGLNSIPIWCKPRNVLSVGEGFRVDVALNIDNNIIFDEFTSTIDRYVAKSTCKSLAKYIKNNGLHHIIFSSCHKDFINFLNPDIVVDLDEEKVYDCREVDLGEILPSQSTNTMVIRKDCGGYLGTIII